MGSNRRKLSTKREILAEWEIVLRKAYNKVAEKKRYDRIPGHDGDAKFLNVADIAMKLFDMRHFNNSIKGD